ncbi:MAG: sel1 repeat family protein [Proteobacteria bacterium]|nr:sel1 repeat family protein [Pseudomonadota bacterium]
MTTGKLTFLLFLFCLVFPCYADFKAGGDAYIRGDYEAAAAEFIPLAERGDHRAMYALGSMYAEGHGVEKDLKKSFKLFSEAAQNGRADAMYKLGLMYEEGLGVKKSLKKALRWYQKSSKKGYPLSQYRFGLMYADGKGVKHNPTTAYAWLVVAGHYFIYESLNPDDEEINKAKPDSKQQLLLFHKQEKERILDAIIEQLQLLKENMTTEDIETTRKKVIKFRQYRKTYNIVDSKDSLSDSKIENLFLPETLY